MVWIEMIPQRANDLHAWAANLFLQPGRGLFAYPVVVADGRAGLADSLQISYCNLRYSLMPLYFITNIKYRLAPCG
jgi:hypothetical protein